MGETRSGGSWGGSGGRSKQRSQTKATGGGTRSGGSWGGGSDGEKKGGGGFLGKGVLLDALNVLDRPGQAVKGLIKDAREDAGTGDTLSHLGKALTGHSHLSSQEALGTHVKGPLGAVVNFTGDVALDPTTYLTFGTGAAAKQGLKAAGEHLGATVAKDIAEKGTKKALSDTQRATLRHGLASAEGGSEKAADKVLRALDKGGRGGAKVLGHTVPGTDKVLKAVAEHTTTPLGKVVRGSKVGEALIPRAGIERTLGKDLADDVGAIEAQGRAIGNNATAEALAGIKKAAKAAKVTRAELTDVVLPAIDVGGHAIAVPERLRPLVDHLKTAIEDTTARQQAAELLPGAREDYVARFLTPEAKAALGPEDAVHYGKGLGNEPGAVSRQAGHVKERTFMPEAPLLEADAALSRDLGLKGHAYETNPLLTTAKRSALANRAVAQRHVFDEIAKLKDATGKPILQAADGAKKPLGWVTKDYGEFGVFHAHPEVAKELDHVRKVIVNEDSIAEFRGLIGKLNTLWKAQATVPFIGGAGFHLRNAQGNIFNNFLAGVKNPADYARAAKLQRGIRTGKLSAADARLVELAKKHGVLDEGFFLHDLMDPKAKGGELGRVAKDQLGARVRAAVNPVSTENVAIRSGRAVGSAVENNARLAHFIAKLRDLGSADAAARSVKKYLFDYGDLAPFEREGIKKYIAFYTWMRKNTPLQFAEAARQPGKFTALAHYQEEATKGRDMGSLPYFLQDEPFVPLGIAGQQIAVRPDLPPFAALEQIDPRKQSDLGIFGGFLPALIKYAAEEKMNRSFFTGLKEKGSTPQRLTEALMPLTGKIRRAPYGSELPTGAGIGLNSDDPQQQLARLIAALTGLRTYRTDAER